MMDQSIYLPPSGFHHPPYPPPPSANPTPTFTSNPTPPPPPLAAPAHNAQFHPPYEQMIISAIEALKEKNGSSRQAISKYIERVYTNLPPTHSAMLTSHLKRMKNDGVLVMDKYSYMLAGSEFSPLPNTPASVPLPLPASAVAPSFTLITTSLPVNEQVHTSVVFDQAPDLNGPGRETTPVVKRGRGRPPKVRVDADGNGTVKKTVGTPREPESQTMSLPRHRGRPRKAAAETAVVAGEQKLVLLIGSI